MPRIIQQKQVEKELLARNCKKLRDYTFGTGSLWQTADGKLAFVVPQGIGGWAYEDVLRERLEMLDAR